MIIAATFLLSIIATIIVHRVQVTAQARRTARVAALYANSPTHPVFGRRA